MERQMRILLVLKVIRYPDLRWKEAKDKHQYKWPAMHRLHSELLCPPCFSQHSRTQQNDDPRCAPGRHRTETWHLHEMGEEKELQPSPLVYGMLC